MDDAFGKHESTCVRCRIAPQEGDVVFCTECLAVVADEKEKSRLAWIDRQEALLKKALVRETVLMKCLGPGTNPEIPSALAKAKSPMVESGGTQSMRIAAKPKHQSRNFISEVMQRSARWINGFSLAVGGATAVVVMVMIGGMYFSSFVAHAQSERGSDGVEAFKKSQGAKVKELSEAFAGETGLDVFFPPTKRPSKTTICSPSITKTLHDLTEIFEKTGFNSGQKYFDEKLLALRRYGVWQKSCGS